RAALVAHREALKDGGPRRRLVSLVLEDPDAMLWGGELLVRKGEPVGQVTSAAYGATVGACVGLAYVRRNKPVTSDWLGKGGFEVDLAGERIAVKLSLRAPLA
ncbi:MAG: glycine cleavage T C-terminal barrel domain-containing protein, partial [Nocardioides sp.]